ncbi:ACHAETE-SCUTE TRANSCRIPTION FACTOR-RELATED [Salix viminalis]|uniref:ACHAETE-SCUTE TRANSCRIPTION FACTOR-RELATED n=2 Tax=Salix viminalis TaxID=40686 RepID=A0A9Q0U7I7_SALVM|nr:ACHAETE-SCUTE TRANSCRIPTION FACTOR-RELATED [Salix viminalis]
MHNVVNMSSSSANREAASDDQWMYLQGSGSAVLPFENYEICSGNSSLGNFNHHVLNSSLTRATIQNIVNYHVYHTDCGSCTIPLEVSDDPCSAIPESSTLLQVSDHVFSGELDPSILVEEECFPELAMCRNSTEEFAENRFNHQKDLHFLGPRSNTSVIQSGYDKTINELDPVLLLFEQENPEVLPRNDTSEDGGFMDGGSNAITCQKETSLSCPLESSDKLEPIVQDSGKPGTFPEQENQLSVSSSKSGKRVRKGEMNQYRFKLQMEKMESQPHMEGGSTSKKQQHNAKEKVRRMNLNASYLALASLLPNSQRSKKKWSAPGIIDEVLEYIPKLESEIEELTLMKNTELSKIEGRQPHDQQDLSAERQAPTISIHEVGQGEVIVQICSQRRDKEDAALSNLFQNLEEQSISIVSASSINVREQSTVCHHLHIKVCHSLPRIFHVTSMCS